jgi:hypothetical protein
MNSNREDTSFDKPELCRVARLCKLHQRVERECTQCNPDAPNIEFDEYKQKVLTMDGEIEDA